jgi:branched-chain amino acid transport system permease protein
LLVQLLANGVAAGSAFALVALGFSFIYAATRFFNFSHAAVYAFGAYVAWSLDRFLGFPLWVSVGLAVMLAGSLGAVSEVIIYRPLRERHASPLVLLVASLGLYAVLQNIVSLTFGDQTLDFYAGAIPAIVPIWGARVTVVQLVTTLASVGSLLAMWLAVRRVRIGSSVRVVASDQELATTVGVDSRVAILFAVTSGSALAGLAGVLVALDVGLVPTMGLNALLMGVVAMIIGGTGDLLGAAAGGLLLGLALNLSAWKIGTEWQQVVAFGILLIFLLFRPYGIFGRKLRKAEI